MAGTTGLLDGRRASVFFDRTLTDPQLDHPEGVAVHRDGSVWCGGERGQIFRIDPDGASVEEVASTGGFCLRMAFDRADDLPSGCSTAGSRWWWPRVTRTRR